jgi:nitrogen fixation NifU-like protein
MSAALYGGAIDEHARNPRNRGPLAAPDAAHEGTNPLCGDRIRIELKVISGRIAAARFGGEACKVSIAAASILTGMLEGLVVADAAALAREKLLGALGTELRPSRVGCALLPLDVLRGALGGGG